MARSPPNRKKWCFQSQYWNFIWNPKSWRASKSPIGLKVTTIFLNGWILPTGEVASGRVCACSLYSRLVNFILDHRKKVKNNTLLLRRLAHIIVIYVLLLVFLVNKILKKSKIFKIKVEMVGVQTRITLYFHYNIMRRIYILLWDGLGLLNTKNGLK